MVRFLLSISALLLIVQACSTFPTHKPIAPTVEIAGIRPLNLSLTRQRLEFRLLVANPNAFDLPLQALKFTAALDGKQIADGFSEQRVTLPAGGKAEVKVEVATKLSRLLGRIETLLSNPEESVNYAVKGAVKLANWPAPIAFDNEGSLTPPVK